MNVTAQSFEILTSHLLVHGFKTRHTQPAAPLLPSHVLLDVVPPEQLIAESVRLRTVLERAGYFVRPVDAVDLTGTYAVAIEARFDPSNRRAMLVLQLSPEFAGGGRLLTQAETDMIAARIMNAPAGGATLGDAVKATTFSRDRVDGVRVADDARRREDLGDKEAGDKFVRAIELNANGWRDRLADAIIDAIAQPSYRRDALATALSRAWVDGPPSGEELNRFTQKLAHVLGMNLNASRSVVRRAVMGSGTRDQSVVDEVIEAIVSDPARLQRLVQAARVAPSK